ncbi:MAG: hypothetical protein QN198_09715 [Armatimonadota bacterium]|nr:hypothetical protein [Armatimonadota bacterium]MDR5703862.1 hypothetical protein [Armatimonadota bacterium]
MNQRRVVSGIVLIVLGIIFLVAQQTGIGGEGVVASIGVAFLVAYAFTRNYGLLVPGGIMTGLGIGIIYEARMDRGGAPVLLGLGLGFLSITVIDLAVRRTQWGWWPLIPGGVLSLIGLLLAAGQAGILGTIGRWWPAILILIGLALLLRRRAE